MSFFGKKKQSTAKRTSDDELQPPPRRRPSIILTLGKQSKTSPASPSLVQEDVFQHKGLNIDIPKIIITPPDEPKDTSAAELGLSALPPPKEGSSKEGSPSDSSSDENEHANYLIASRQLLVARMKRDSKKEPPKSRNATNLKGIKSRSTKDGQLTPDNRIAGTAGSFGLSSSTLKSSHTHLHAAITGDPLDRLSQREHVHKRNRVADPLTHEWVLGEAGLAHRTKLVIDHETQMKEFRRMENEMVEAEAEISRLKETMDEFTKALNESG